jgi:hypothetical protein
MIWYGFTREFKGRGKGKGSSMSKDIVKYESLDYEPKKLNALMEPGAKQYAYKKLRKYQESKGWVFNPETKDFNPVSDEEDIEREIYFGLNVKMVAIFASDKKGAVHSVDDFLALAENDLDGFNALYSAAIERTRI